MGSRHKPAEYARNGTMRFLRANERAVGCADGDSMAMVVISAFRAEEIFGILSYRISFFCFAILKGSVLIIISDLI